ncbi:hypothetical protein FQZ97_1218020 [compost metagenome]
MQQWVEAQAELAGEWPLRFPAQLLASLQVIVHRFFERLAQFADGLAVETDHVADAGDMADEQGVIVAVFDVCGVAFVFHGAHGSIPACSRKARASRT